MVEASVSTDDTNEGQGCTKRTETSTRLQNYKAQCTRLAALKQNGPAKPSRTPENILHAK